MFEPCDHPRVFGVPPGADFPAALVRGLIGRHADRPPEALARVRLIVNTRRMQRRIRALFDRGPALLLPRISVITELGETWSLGDIPPPVPPLRRRLELVQLVAALLERQPDIAPRAALFDLADSLADLMDEMHGEGVPPERIAALDISDHSGHWARIRAFLGIIRDYFDAAQARPDSEARQRRVIAHLIARWQEAPPGDPVILAGSTGSRGATQLLMQAVARLDQGAVILPGFDYDLPDGVWAALDDPLRSEDHPQFRFRQYLTALGLTPSALPVWQGAAPPNPARNRVTSLALRPAPVTDQWRTDGPTLRGLEAAMAEVTLLEAPSARMEALTIAMRLRQAAEDGQTAALITPDRTLARQVAAALDRWRILPDDSAGLPLHLSAPGRFLRHVAGLFEQRPSAEALLTLLKHPLTHSGSERGPHLLLTRALELHLRRHGPPYPTAAHLTAWAANRREALAPDWAAWLSTCLAEAEAAATAPLSGHVARHLGLAQQLAQGCRGEGAGKLWQDSAGIEARRATDALRREAGYGGVVRNSDYSRLFEAILARHEVRNPETPHPHIRIWGTLEARVQGADLLILAGLNEGTWPAAPAPDPWLNRALRLQAGLLVPQRRIGLAAHDFQQAVAAPEVWLTRAVRSDDAQTVASRWLNRLQNLLDGLPEQGGTAALAAMRGRGQAWLARAERLEEPGTTPPAPRPAPCPPVAARPRRLSVTEIKRLIRDPYAIYAKHVLGLRPLDPLMKVPDALMRGIVVHEVLEEFIRDTAAAPERCTEAAFSEKCRAVLAARVPWAEARAAWQARLERVAGWFVAAEQERRLLARPAAFEARGQAELPALGFTLTAMADRIDLDRAGNLHLYDYKTGRPPTAREQAHFDKQLLLEAAIAERAGFGELAPARVARAVYIGLSGQGQETDAPLDDEPPGAVWSGLEALIRAYLGADQGYTARRAAHSARETGDYDQLARFGEWDITDAPQRDRVG